MMNPHFPKWPLAVILALTLSAFSSSASFAQQGNCLPVGEVNQLVKTQKILSFNKIKKIVGLKKGAKIFGQRLCEVNGRFVYFFKIVDAKGNALGVALRANDGKPFKGNG